MIAPEDYQQPQDPVAWTCVREPLTRWLDGVFNDYAQWQHRDPIIRAINKATEPWAVQEQITRMVKDHLAGQWSTLSQDYQWEEIELWPITDFDRARRENGARWSQWVRDNPAGEPWVMNPTRLDHIRDFVGRINDWSQFLAEWSKVYDRDLRMWHRVEQHHSETNEPLVLTRRQFQSRATWPPVDHPPPQSVDLLWQHLMVED